MDILLGRKTRGTPGASAPTTLLDILVVRTRC